LACLRKENINAVYIENGMVGSKMLKVQINRKNLFLLLKKRKKEKFKLKSLISGKK